MAKRTSLPYNPNNKEPWHIEFEKENVNDDFWSCIVAAAVPAEPSELECVGIFNQVAEMGVRSAIRTITAADVVKVLKSSDKKTKEKEKGMETKRNVEPPPLRSNEIVTLSLHYAVFGEGGCKLPPDLMAGVIKYLILNMKDQDCFQRRISKALNRKLKEEEAKKKFIKNYLMEEDDDDEESNLGKISDEPFGGPQMYILLSGFYDIGYFLELNRLKVTFLALIRFERFREIVPKEESHSGSQSQKNTISEFWNIIKRELNNAETTSLYKDIVMLKYNVPRLGSFESTEVARSTIFDDVSQILYCTFFIYKHHQNYLQQLTVHPVAECLEPLDLAKCEIYNNLCDYFSPGGVGDEFLVLYSIIEQVVGGLPEIKYKKIEYSLPETNFFEDDKEEGGGKSKEREMILAPPCKKCRKKCGWEERLECEVNISESENEVEELNSEKEWLPEIGQVLPRKEKCVSVDLTREVLQEKMVQKENPKKKYWASPKIFAYGDTASARCFNFDIRIVDPTSVVERFLFESMIPILWAKYPELTPADRSYYDYQFYRLREVSDDDEESLRLKIHFMILMNMVAFTGSIVHRGDDDNVSQMWDVGSFGRFSLPPIISDDKFRRSSGESVWGQVSKTDFWRMFFKKIYDFPLGEGQKPKSIKVGFGFRRETEGCILRKVASASDLFKPCEIPVVADDQSAEANFAKKASSEEIFEEEVNQLWKIFECPDISSLEDSIFLTDFDKFQDFAKSFNVYENLNSVSMVQRLRSASDAYNVIQFNYFFPTDTLMLLMYNDCDYRGIYFDNDYGYMSTPVSLRDFYSFIFFEIKNWLKAEDKKYDAYVWRRKEKEKLAEKRKEEEILTKIKMEFSAMSEAEKAEFLGMAIKLRTQLEAGTSKKPKIKTEKNEKKKKNDPQLIITKKDLEPLPKREKPKKPNEKSFFAINLSDVRVQVNTKNVQFYSRDGSNVNIMTLTWLYDPKRLIRLKIKKSDVEIFYCYYVNQPLVKSFDFVTKSGIRFVFFAKPESSNFLYFMKATWPSGLVVETKLGPEMYVKQSYVENGPDDEKCRCFLRESKVLIFRKNGNMDILCADSTKYGCYEFEIPEEMECDPVKSESKGKRKSKDKSVTAVKPEMYRPPIKIHDYDILTPRGEFFAKPSRPKGSNAPRLVDTLKVLVGEDKRNQEIFYRREDGTNRMFWSDGKLVTTFKDGTKITTQPEFQEEEIFVEWSDEEKLYFAQLEANMGGQRRSTKGSVRSILRSSSRKSDTSASSENPDSGEGFVSVKMSYLMEHPKYSTVFYPAEETYTQVNMPEVEMLIRPNGTYKLTIESDLILTLSENKVEFYQECFHCGKKSSSIIDFSSDQDPDSILCKTVDFFGRVFVLYGNGETVVDSGPKDIHSEDSSETDELKPEWEYFCDHDASVGSKQRLFVLKRNLSGMEFLHDDSLTEYNGDHVGDTDKCRHFYKPLEKEKWNMDYQCQDSLPTFLKRKDLMLLGSLANHSRPYRYPFSKRGSQMDGFPPGNQTIVNPEGVVVRTIRFLKPGPVEILNGMVSIIKAYQDRSKECFTAYKEHSAPQETSEDERHIKMRLRKIALTLNRSLKFFHHSGIITPSTDEDIHYIAHRRDLNEYFARENEDTNRDREQLLPDCKYLRNVLPFPKRGSVISEIME